MRSKQPVDNPTVIGYDQAMPVTTNCARCNTPVWENSAGTFTSGHPSSGCSTTCGSTALLHTLDADLAASTNHEFRPWTPRDRWTGYEVAMGLDN